MCCFFVLLVGFGSTSAEILQEVGPLQSLGQIKKQYPNAIIVRVKAAWVRENEDFFSLQGDGFPVVLYIAFSDGRPTFRKMAQDEARRLQEAGEAQLRNVPHELAAELDDNALTVKWTLWVPSLPIPFVRYKSKYGEPSKCDFLVTTMAPYCEWSSLDLQVTLNDEKTLVHSVETGFTSAEWRSAYMAKYGIVPNFLREMPSGITQHREGLPKK